MESIKVEVEIERTRKIFNKYFSFQRNKELKKFPVIPISAVFIAFIVIGTLANIQFLSILGLISLGLEVLIIIYYLVRFRIYRLRYMSSLEKRIELYPENSFTFAFDESKIYTESENISLAIKWNLIEKYCENEGDLYLYLKNNELYDIISVSIIGKDAFERFKYILDKNVVRIN